MATYKILAATGCPTGIAHTYMAAEALEQAAKTKGITIKVETHGQIGIENELTNEEIQAADAIIIAADKDVQSERFAGKRVIEVPVSKGIKDAAQLIDDALQGKGRVLKGNSEEVVSNDQKDPTNIGHKIYKHLMNGVSHMLPFVVGGGVLIAVSFLWGIYSADPNNAQYNEFAAMLKTIGGTSMGLMVPVLSAYIAESISKRPGLIVGFVGGMIALTGETGFLGGIVSGFIAGYIIILLSKLFKKLPKSLDGLKVIFLMTFLSSPMAGINKAMMDFLAGFENSNPLILGIIVGSMSAFDMGGPVNKAAYVTGTALLAQGNTTFMAGVSAACIAPPLMTTIAVLFFKDAYTKEDRNAGFVNLILGSTHITEGAIPFAAMNPLKNIPAMMLGSSVAAVLTYLFKVQVPAPHGGFLVLPVVTHGLLWILAILAGAMVGGLLLGFIQMRSKKNK